MREKCCKAPTPASVHAMDTERGVVIWGRVCLLCRSPLGLGDSNDTPAAVRIEIEAARLAQLQGSTYVSNDAWSGFDAHKRGWEPVPTHDAQAGWLAREIIEHDHAPPRAEAKRKV
jgi:hypothetical protein